MKRLSALVLLYCFISLTSAWALEITSPEESQVFNAGDTVSIIVKPSPGEDWIGVIYGIYKMDYYPLTGEYKVKIKIPPSLSGLHILTVTGVDKSGTEIELKRSIFVKLPLNVVLQGIVAGGNGGSTSVYLEKMPEGSNAIDTENFQNEQLSTYGKYSDNVNRSLTSSTSGTTYTSSNEKVATVSSEGKVTAQGLGTATITVKNGKYSATVKVVVKPYKK